MKGGTGKSTSCALTSRAVAACRTSGKKVLEIDLDPNYSLTTAFIPANIKELDPSGTKTAKAALDDMEHFDNLRDYIIPSNYPNIDLMRATPMLSRLRPPLNLLSRKIEASKLDEEYDYIFIDTSATYGDLHILYTCKPCKV